MNIEEEIARQNREIEDSLAKMTESINAQMKRMMERSCHFADANPSNVMYPMAFGDTISSISSTICCNGKRYHAVETEEHGRKKFMNCYLYEYNKKRELYNEIASLC